MMGQLGSGVSAGTAGKEYAVRHGGGARVCAHLAADVEQALQERGVLQAQLAGHAGDLEVVDLRGGGKQ